MKRRKLEQRRIQRQRSAHAIPPHPSLVQRLIKRVRETKVGSNFLIDHDLADTLGHFFGVRHLDFQNLGAVSRELLLPRTNYSLKVIQTSDTPQYIVTIGTFSATANSEAKAFLIAALHQREPKPRATERTYDEKVLQEILNSGLPRIKEFREDDDYGPRGTTKYIDYLGLVLTVTLREGHYHPQQFVRTRVLVKRNQDDPFTQRDFDSPSRYIMVGQRGKFDSAGVWVDLYKSAIMDLKAEITGLRAKEKSDKIEKEREAKLKRSDELEMAERILWRTPMEDKGRVGTVVSPPMKIGPY